MAKSRFPLVESSFKFYICIQKIQLPSMLTKTLSPMVISHKEQLTKDIWESDILIVRQVDKVFMSNEDFVLPHIIITLCLRGSARSKYDMQVITHRKNDLTVFMPGHIMQPLEGSEDFSYALLFISPKLFRDLRYSSFSHDFDKYNYNPVSTLTDAQSASMLAILDLLIAIAGEKDRDMPHRYQAILAQLNVGYELLNSYRYEQDKHWEKNRQMEIYRKFCDLVVKNYRKSREVKYYAALLNLTPKYISKVIRNVTGGLYPAEWIEQYVIMQAKRLIDNRSAHTLQEIAFMLGFSEPATFYRYFKRVTGMTAKQYRSGIQR